MKEGDEELTDEQKKKIREYALQIMDRGGLCALQMNLYTMIHFHAKTYDEKVRMQELQYVFHRLENKNGQVWLA